MLPWDFARLSPREFHLLLTGARNRRRETWRLAAQLACWLLAPWSKKTLTVEKLIKLPPDQ